jgi:O-antigen/teichoic acid export membrane protein
MLRSVKKNVLYRAINDTLPLVHDSALTRVAVNSARILRGSASAAVLNTLTVAIAARSLGASQFGAFTLVIAYVAAIEKAVSFQVWQSIIAFGSKSHFDHDKERFSQLVGFGWTIDLVSAICSSLIAVGGSKIAGNLLGWPSELTVFAAAAGVTLALRLSGTAIATLRLFDKFNRLAAHQTLTALAKLLLVLAASFSTGSLSAILFSWFFSDVLGALLLLILAGIELQGHGISRISLVSPSIIEKQFPGIRRFLVTTNLHSTVKLVYTDLDVLIVGALSGPAVAGAYRIIKLVGASLSKLAEPLYQAVYPDLSRLAHEKNRVSFESIIYSPIRMLAVLCSLFLLIYIIVGTHLLEVLFGSGYSQMHFPSIVYLAGSMIAVSTYGFHPGLLALGKASASFYSLLAAAMIYLVGMILMTPQLGVLGASVAYLLSYLSWALLQHRTLRKELASIG